MSARYNNRPRNKYEYIAERGEVDGRMSRHHLKVTIEEM